MQALDGYDPPIKPDKPPGQKTITQEEFEKRCNLHDMWWHELEGGVRGDFSYLDLTMIDFKKPCSLMRADFFHSDLSGLDLSTIHFDEANFVGANLTGCKVTATSFKYCNFHRAILTQCNMGAARLHGCTGNGKEVKSLQTNEKFNVVYTHKKMWIGCMCLTLDKWDMTMDEYDDIQAGVAKDFARRYAAPGQQGLIPLAQEVDPARNPNE